MLQKIKELWSSFCVKGIQLPFALDPETDKPSITLMFYWITSTLSVISLILLHIGIVEYRSTGMSIVFVLMAFVMYRMRKLDKFKIDLDDQTIELENETPTPTNKDNNNEQA